MTWRFWLRNRLRFKMKCWSFCQIRACTTSGFVAFFGFDNFHTVDGFLKVYIMTFKQLLLKHAYKKIQMHFLNWMIFNLVKLKWFAGNKTCVKTNNNYLYWHRNWNQKKYKCHMSFCLSQKKIFTEHMHQLMRLNRSSNERND